MLIRPAFVATTVFLGTTATAFLGQGTALAGPCQVIDNTVVCDLGGGQHTPGSSNGGSGGSGGPGSSGPNNGCQNQGQGVPGAGCTQNPPNAVQQTPPIDIAIMARLLIQPAAPTISWSPKPRTFVKMRTGFWLSSGYTSYSKSLPVDGQVVKATATPRGVDWNLVESRIHCAGAGSAKSTACGYTYQRSSSGQPGGSTSGAAGKYHITATVTWTVTLQCTAGCVGGGTLDDITQPGNALIPVGEIQTESGTG